MSVPIEVGLGATNLTPRSGEWIGAFGTIFNKIMEEPVRHAEVWLKVNSVYEKCIPQASWNQRYWFSLRLGPGRYFLETEAYKVRVEGDPHEYKVSSPRVYLTVTPAVGGLPPRKYQIETWRKIKLDEAMRQAKKASDFIRSRYPDTTNTILVGSVVKRGWTRRDIDFVVFSKTLLSECTEPDEEYPDEYWAKHLIPNIESLIGYPTDVFAKRNKKYLEMEGIAHVFPVRRYPAAIPFRPRPELVNDDGFTFWHGMQLDSADEIKQSGMLYPVEDVIGLTDDFFYATEWARVRRREKRRIGPMAVVELVVPKTFQDKMIRKEPTSSDILFHGQRLPVRVVQIREV